MKTAKDSNSPVTLMDIAKYCGVAKSTVSYALRDKPCRISHEMLTRIRKVAVEFGYDAASHHAARVLSMRKTRTRIPNHLMALFLPPYFLAHAYYRRMLEGIMEVATREKFGALLSYDNHFETSGEVLPALAHGDVDGALALCNPHDFRVLETILKSLPGFAGRPITFLMEIRCGYSHVITDDETAAYEAALHLLKLGHRKILHFGEAANAMSMLDRRLNGYLRACDEMQLDPAQILVSAPPTWQDTEDNISMRANRGLLLQQNPPITAIITRNDQMAIAIYKYLYSEGVRVPEDISLIGHDDTQTLSNEIGTNILTTIKLPLEEVGRQAARILIDHITEVRTDQRQIVLPAEFIVRSSTAPPPHG